MVNYDYSVINDTVNAKVESRQLHNEILSSVISTPLCSVGTKNSILTICFESLVTAQEKTILDGVVNAHQGDLLATYKTLVVNAMAFFDEIMVEFAAENITQGITYYNKTKDVSDYLASVMRYGQSGSLYEVINEIDALMVAGLPVNLEPFVTQAKLDSFKLKVQSYLN